MPLLSRRRMSLANVRKLIARDHSDLEPADITAEWVGGKKTTYLPNRTVDETIRKVRIVAKGFAPRTMVYRIDEFTGRDSLYKW